MRAVRAALGLHGDGSQRLADAVVQLAGDAQALLLLRGQGTPSAAAAFLLEAIEHGVERLDEGRDLGVGVVDPGEPTSRIERVDRTHQSGELLQGGERPPQQEEGGDQHRDHRAHDESKLPERDRCADRDRREDEQKGSDDQDDGVGKEQPQQQRTPFAPRRLFRWRRPIHGLPVRTHDRRPPRRPRDRESAPIDRPGRHGERCVRRGLRSCR
jgi:hypothetical protein